MKFFALILFVLCLVPPATAAEPAADIGLAEVGVMGRLNGQALACSHMEAVSKIKALIIKFAPKSRRYGEAFETATNDEYLAQARKDKTACPDATAFSEQLDEAAKRLQTVFAINANDKNAP